MHDCQENGDLGAAGIRFCFVFVLRCQWGDVAGEGDAGSPGGKLVSACRRRGVSACPAGKAYRRGSGGASPYRRRAPYLFSLTPQPLVVLGCFFGVVTSEALASCFLHSSLFHPGKTALIPNRGRGRGRRRGGGGLKHDAHQMPGASGIAHLPASPP
jgi:hypothetical protein